jgi:hypothetical protein
VIVARPGLGFAWVTGKLSSLEQGETMDVPGFVRLASRYSVDDTVDRLKAMFSAKGITAAVALHCAGGRGS